MGFASVRRLYCEIMGKYSNLVFTDGNDKILSVLTPVDFSTSSKRQVLPGMTYELPPPQEKTDPLTVDEAAFNALLAKADPAGRADKWITSAFLGISAAALAQTRVTGTVVDAQGEIRKVLINDQVFIIRGEKVYTTDGQLVK
jgi:hypothetical protein